MTESFEQISVAPLTGAVGAEISGVNLAEELSNSVFAEIRGAFHRYGVIFFRDQDLSPVQHLAFARRWGPINVNRFFEALPEHPEIAEVRKEPHQTSNIGSRWHSDHSYDQAPALGSLLYARAVPDSGGDTLFASMGAAYECLSPGMKKALAGLRALHSSRHVFGAEAHDNPRSGDLGGRIGNPDAALQDVYHPVVLTHPDTGRKGLFVNPTFTRRFEDWTEAESQPLLETLYGLAYHPENCCRFRWTEGAMAIWDNRAVWHLAVNDYPGGFRLMHRVTVEGVALQ